MSFAILLLVGIGGSAADRKPADKDKESIQGLWQAIDLEANGKKAPAEAVKSFQVRVKDDSLVFSPDTDNRKHAFTLLPDAKPKALDLTPFDGPAKGKKLSCAIYKLEGDTLTICLDKKDGSKRPKEFKTEDGDGFALIKLERVKGK
ncbi:MAG TPA: TIGR03067 domain-containing protein [Urbifossiella sp.]